MGMQQRGRLTKIAFGALGLASAVSVSLSAFGAPPKTDKARAYFTHGPPHVPNFVVIARAIAVTVSARAAGQHAPMAVVESSGAGAAETVAERFTESPMEVPRKATRIDPGAQFVPALRVAWPAIGERGARTLAAQFALETGAGRHCYNFNFGNHKAGAKELHTYLKGVWEGIPARQFQAMKANGALGALLREEPANESLRKGHRVPVGALVVLLDPPHPAARFRANRTLQDGIERFVAHHERIAARDPAYLSALARGDVFSVARILGSPAVRYFTGNVDAYAEGMASHREILDEGLGPSF
jgi:hypothetical protein